MYKDKKVIVVLPAYNAGATLEKTYKVIPFPLVDEVILCDDASKDNIVEIGSKLGIKHIISHEQNKGYGGPMNFKIYFGEYMNLIEGGQW